MINPVATCRTTDVSVPFAAEIWGEE